MRRMTPCLPTEMILSSARGCSWHNSSWGLHVVPNGSIIYLMYIYIQYIYIYIYIYILLYTWALNAIPIPADIAQRSFQRFLAHLPLASPRAWIYVRVPRRGFGINSLIYAEDPTRCSWPSFGSRPLERRSELDFSNKSGLPNVVWGGRFGVHGVLLGPCAIGWWKV